MGQKDIGEKMLEAHNDVFADIVNALLFQGREVLKPDELEEQAPRSAYKADGKYREIERDVAKRWKTGDIRVACVGIENQTKSDRDMPLRVFAYDGAEYRAQLNPENQNANRYPVVTLVLYFDYKKKWDEPLNLLGCLNVPEEFRPFVNDYRVNLFDIAYLSEEQVKLFKSDFRFVADYFVQMRTTGQYTGSHEEIKYVQETLSLMAIMTQDNRFETVLANDSGSDRKEIKNMCEALDKMIEKGKAEGRAEGIAEGRAEGIAEGRVEGIAEGKAEGKAEGEMKRAVDSALRMIESGKLSLEDIACFTDLPLSKVQELANGRIA